MFLCYVYILIPIITGAIHLGIASRPLAKGKSWEIWLQHFIFWGVGIGGLWAYMTLGFDFWGNPVNQWLGWAFGGVYQRLAGYFYLAMAVLGILSPCLRGGFWVATTLLAVMMAIFETTLLFVWDAPTAAWVYAIVYDLVGSALLIFLHLGYRARVGRSVYWGVCGLSCPEAGKKKAKSPRRSKR